MLDMRIISIAVVCSVIMGCTAKQPESLRTVAAYEVPLPTEEDRSRFLSVLRAAATADGMHVDATNSQQLQILAKGSPEAKMTLHAAVWRDRTNDDEVVASAMDQYDHLGKVWLTFSKGTNPTVARKFRESVVPEIMLRWPETLSLPIMPTGAIPLRRDLVRTPTGYVVNPIEANRYGLKSQATGSH
jgi:hypothetical protein